MDQNIILFGHVERFYTGSRRVVAVMLKQNMRIISENVDESFCACIDRN